MAALELVWDLIARDGASPAFARVGAAAEGASAAVGTFLKTMTPLAGGALLVGAIKGASDFNAKMALIQTQAGASAAEVKKMAPAMLSLAGQVAQAPEALATSLYHVESTGLRGAQALEAVKIAAEGARVGHADLEQTTNALTATIASGMLPATETYAQAMGQLNAIVGSGDMKMQDLNEALASGLLVTVKQFGVNINDVGAALADFGDNNIRGADAATKLRMAVQAIAKPGVDAGAALGKIGLSVQQIQDDLSQHGLNAALTDLHDHLVKSGISATQWGQLMTDAFTKKAGAGIITLIGTFDRFEQKYKEVSDGANKFGDEWAATTKTAAFQFAALKDKAEALGVSVGNVLLPAASGLAHVIGLVLQPIAKIVGWFGELPGPVKDAAVAFGLLVVLRGPLTSMFETIALKALYLRDGVVAASTSTTGLSAAMGRVAGMFTPMTIGITSAVVLLPSLIELFKKMTDASDSAVSATKSLSDAIKANNGVIDDSIRKQAQQQLAGLGVVDTFKKAGVSAKDAIDGLLGNAAAHDRVTAALQRYLAYGQKTQGQVSGIADAAGNAINSYDKLATALGTSREELAYFGNAASGTASATAAAGQAAADATPKLEYLGDAAGMSKDDIDAANKAWESWIKDLSSATDSFVTPLQTYQTMMQQLAQATADSTKSSKDSWQDYVDNVKVDLGKYATQLEDQLKNQEQWKDNLVKIAQRGGFELAQQFADMGVQGATLTAQMANATAANFQRMANDMAQKAAQGSQAAAANLDEGMRIMAEAGKEGAQATAASVANALGIGADEVYNIAQSYGRNLATGLNPVLAQLDKHPIIINTLLSHPMWEGGYTGDGGKFQPMGVVHGGEFVLTKEQTAKAGVGNLYAYAKMLDGFAGGGFVSPSQVPRPYSTAPFGPPLSAAGDQAMNTEYNAAVQWLAHNVGTVAAPGAPANVSGNVALGKLMAARYGWGGGAEWNSLYALWQRESGWRNTAQNPTSTAYGIPQFLNSTWASTGYPKSSDPAVQIAAGLKYIAGRYGDPIRAWGHETSAGWYDQGGWLPPGVSLAINGTGRPERVRTAQQEAALSQPINVRVFVGNQEIRDITRVEIDHALGAVTDTIHYAGA